MIQYTQGNILKADAEALVNTVNCVGVMGRGIALHFKNAYPGNFKAYAAACKRSDVQPGRMFVYETGLPTPRWIINFPTKRHWRGKSRIEDIEAGMDALVAEIRARDISSVAIPPLGSGLGGLAWRDVRPTIERALADLPDLRAIVYEPGGGPQETAVTAVPKMTAGRAALVGLIRLLATAHWVAHNENAHTDQAIEDAFYAWNPQKAQFTPEQIAIAVVRLRAGGWIADDEPIQAADTR